jgi:hypothetical protein
MVALEENRQFRTGVFVRSGLLLITAAELFRDPEIEFRQRFFKPAPRLRDSANVSEDVIVTCSMEIVLEATLTAFILPSCN